MIFEREGQGRSRVVLSYTIYKFLHSRDVNTTNAITVLKIGGASISMHQPSLKDAQSCLCPGPMGMNCLALAGGEEEGG